MVMLMSGVLVVLFGIFLLRGRIIGLLGKIRRTEIEGDGGEGRMGGYDRSYPDFGGRGPEIIVVIVVLVIAVVTLSRVSYGFQLATEAFCSPLER